MFLIESKIKKVQEDLSIKYNEANVRSPRNQVVTELISNLGELKTLKAERRELNRDLDDLKAKYDSLKEECSKDGVNVGSLEDIDKMIQQLNLKLISERIDAKEERRIASELHSLKAKKSNIGELNQNLKNSKIMESSMNECKEKFT